MPGKRGGARPNSGPAKGTKYAPTLAKEAAREIARQMITAKLEPLIEAQVANAQGIKYLVGREKGSGKFTRLTQAQVEAVLSGEDDKFIALEVWEKDPSVQAYTDLMNRYLDKPKEQEQTIVITDTRKMTDAELETKIAAIQAKMKKTEQKCEVPTVPIRA